LVEKLPQLNTIWTKHTTTSHIENPVVEVQCMLGMVILRQNPEPRPGNSSTKERGVCQRNTQKFVSKKLDIL
jgi:hypothetical protein